MNKKNVQKSAVHYAESILIDETSLASKIRLVSRRMFKSRPRRKQDWCIERVNSQSSFTLIEILVVLALIAILAAVLIVIINPVEIFKKGRDSQRISDIKNIEKMIDSIYSVDDTFSELQYASSNIVYISLKDSNPNCSSWLSQLPSLPLGWSYHCSNNPENLDGSGWIPIPFSKYPVINVSKLLIDPINKPPYYYSFVVGGSYKLAAKPETNYSAAIDDGGIEPLLIEAGNNKQLSTFQSGLIGYWNFDDCTAKDSSGNNNNGTIYGATCVDGKVGKALSFDGVDDYVDTHQLSNCPFHGTPAQYTILAWFKTNTLSSTQIIYEEGGIINGFNLYIYNNKAYIGAWAESGGWDGDFLDITTDLNWHNLALIFKAYEFLKMYYDGSLVSQSNISYAMYQHLGADSIGRGSNDTEINNVNQSGNGFYFSGLIDEVRVYNRALSDSEIKALYEALNK